jgi:hypothetical protein
MQQAPSRIFTWSFAVALAAIGGFAAVVGVLLGWWDAESSRASEIFGNEQVESRLLLGTAHWSGWLALLVGFAVTLAALGGLVLARPDRRRPAALASLAGGIVVIGAAAIGFAQANGVADAQVGGPGLGVEAFVGGGLILSAGGGLVAAVGGFLALRASKT